MKARTIKTYAFSIAALLGVIASASAQSTWTGAGGNNNWNNPDNWAGGNIPGNTGTAVFGDADSYTVDRNTTGNAATHLVFTKGAGAYTFTGNRFQINNTLGASITNLSGETVTFNSGLQFSLWSGQEIRTDYGDIVVENGIVGPGSYAPSKYGIGTLTVRGVDGVLANGILRVFAGTLVLDGYAQNFGGENQVWVTANNTSAIEFGGEATGITTITKTNLSLNAGNGAASQIRLNSNGGEGVTLAFTQAYDPGPPALFALGRAAPATLNVDLSNHANNRVSFASVNTNTATAMSNGIFRWGTVTDMGGTGFATMDGTNFVRNTTTTLFTGSDVTANTTNYHVGNGTTALTASRNTNSLTIHAVNGGAMSGNFNFQTGALLMREGTQDYAINSNVLSPSNSTQLFIHQYSEDGMLIFNGDIYNDSGTGTLIKAGPGTVEVGSTGRLRTSGITYVQGGTFVVNGEIERSSEVRVFHTATLEGSGEIGTEAASAVRIYGGGVLAGDTSGALDITGTLTLDSYSHLAMTLDYAGNQFVDVSGAITLQENVNLNLTLAAAPVLNEKVTLLGGASFGGVGTFETINGQAFGTGGTFTLRHQYGPGVNDWTDYTFTIGYETNSIWVQAIPEPSAALLAGIGVALVLMRRRRATKN